MAFRTRGEPFDPKVLGFTHREIPPNRVEPRHPEAPLDLVERVLDQVGVPECGLLVWFDAEFSGTDLFKKIGDPLRMKGAFYPLEHGLDECPLPDGVKDAMMQDMYRLAVWIGKDVVEDSRVAFVVILAHELAHVEQYLYCPQVHHAGNFVLAFLRRLPDEERRRYSYFDSPVERDAEARARQVSAAIYGEDAVRAYMQEQGIVAFVQPQPVGSLPNLIEVIGGWLAEHFDRIVAQLKDLKEPDPILELSSKVDWDKFRLPRPR